MNKLHQAAELVQRMYFCKSEGETFTCDELELFARMLQEDEFRSQVFEAWENTYPPEQ